MNLFERKPQSKCSSKKQRLKKIGRLNRDGMTDGNLGNLEGAEAKLAEALREARIDGHPLLHAKILNDIGIIYSFKGAWDRALVSFDDALKLTVAHRGENNYLFRTIAKNISRNLHIE